MQGKLPLIIALIFGAISFFGILQVLDSQKVETQESTLVVFSKNLAEGEIIKDDDLALLTLEGGDASTSLSGLLKESEIPSVRGSKLVTNVIAGTPALRNLFSAETGVVKNIKFTDLLKSGERAISLPVDSAGMVTGLLVPGDFVDVLANIDIPVKTVKEMNIPNQGIVPMEEIEYVPTTIFLLERVRILAVGSNYLQPENEEDDYRSFSGSTVTIAVSSRAAQVLSFAMRHGRSPGSQNGVTFTLLLRSANDTNVTERRDSVTYDNVLEEAQLKEIQDEIMQLP